MYDNRTVTTRTAAVERGEIANAGAAMVCLRIDGMFADCLDKHIMDPLRRDTPSNELLNTA
jgi:hypothetical protein